MEGHFECAEHPTSIVPGWLPYGACVVLAAAIGLGVYELSQKEEDPTKTVPDTVSQILSEPVPSPHS